MSDIVADDGKIAGQIRRKATIRFTGLAARIDQILQWKLFWPFTASGFQHSLKLFHGFGEIVSGWLEPTRNVSKEYEKASA